MIRESPTHLNCLLLNSVELSNDYDLRFSTNNYRLITLNFTKDLLMLIIEVRLITEKVDKNEQFET